MFCTKCGKKLEDGNKFCTGCGARISGPDSENVQTALSGEGDIKKEHISENTLRSGDTLVKRGQPEQIDAATSVVNNSQSSVDLQQFSGSTSPQNPIDGNSPGSSEPGKKATTKKRGYIVGGAIAVVVIVVVVAAVFTSGFGLLGQKGNEIKTSLEEYSWEEIAQISQEISTADDESGAIEIARKYNLMNENGQLDGSQKKSVELTNGAIVDAVIVGFYHDEKAESNGKAGISFMIVQPVALHDMDSSGSNTGGWEDSRMRAWLSQEGLDLLPAEVRESICKVRKMTNNVGNTYKTESVSMTSDSLWLFSSTEIFGDFDRYKGKEVYINDILNAEGSQYRLFFDKKTSQTQQNEALAKKYADKKVDWWTRSSNPVSKTNFFGVDQGGAFTNLASKDSYGAVVGFCI